MRTGIIIVAGLVLIRWTTSASAQEVIWRAAKPSTPSAPPVVSLGRPQPLSDAAPDEILPPAQTVGQGQGMPRVVRGQMGGAPPPPPPAFPGGAPAPFTPVPAGANPYDLGVVNNNSDLGSFWTRCGDNLKRCWSDVTGSFGSNYKMFESDCEFKSFSSPVTNPFFFLDPRSLTEFRPVFMWQHTPGSNPVWQGGNNFVLAATGSLAITPNFSLVVNRLGVNWISPNGGTPDIQSHVGFSEVLFGPKFTFFRSEKTKTVAAVGLTFDLPVGSADVLQHTGNLMLDPYFSIAQNFGKSDYGSFNFMNTDGYTFRTEGQRSESFFASFHLDYDVGNLNRFYPLVELNYRHYTRNGSARNLDFEGSDLANFGSTSISTQNELTVAVGTRVKITDNIQFGIAGEWNVLNNGQGQHLDQFRLTTDMIFRW